MASSTKTGVAKTPRAPLRRRAEVDSDQEQEEQKTVITSKSKNTVASKVPLDSGKKTETKKVTPAENKETKKPVKKVETSKKTAKNQVEEEDDDAEEEEGTKKKTKKQEDPAELRKKFMTTFPEIHANARSKFVFVVAGKPKSFLQIGGMRAQFGKHPEIVYSLQLNTAGTHDDIDEMLSTPSIHEYLVAQGIIGDDEDEIRSTLITAENFETRKKDKDFKAFEDAKSNTKESLVRDLAKVLSSDKDKPVKISTQEKIKNQFAEYKIMNKVFDVTNWDNERQVGFKSVTRPSTRSHKHLATTMPIIASNQQSISAFIMWLGFDFETARREAAIDVKSKNVKNDS